VVDEIPVVEPGPVVPPPPPPPDSPPPVPPPPGSGGTFPSQYASTFEQPEGSERLLGSIWIAERVVFESAFTATGIPTPSSVAAVP
jgi:hypothetical protein